MAAQGSLKQNGKRPCYFYVSRLGLFSPGALVNQQYISPTFQG